MLDLIVDKLLVVIDDADILYSNDFDYTVLDEHRYYN